MFAPKNMLVPTDFSVYAEAALKDAVDIAAQYKAKIYLLHVIDEFNVIGEFNYPQWDAGSSPDVSYLEQFAEDNSLKQSTERLQKEVNALAETKQVEIVFDIKTGIPAEVILSEQQEKDIDLIVIASHGRTGVLSTLIGSVADGVVKAAKCSVIVIKP